MTVDHSSQGAGGRNDIYASYRRDEREALTPLASLARLPPAEAARVLEDARSLAKRCRELQRDHGGTEALLHEYDLSSEEGVLLMCLAEALLRIPDRETQERLIRDKLSQGHWDNHLGHSPSLFVNASTWGLTLTGRVVTLTGRDADPGARLRGLVARVGAKVVRLALAETMNLMARSFVMSATMDDALRRAHRAGRGHGAIPSTAWARRRAGRVTWRAISRPTATPSPWYRNSSARRPRPRQRARHLRQALGPAPALRIRQARTRLNELAPRLRQLAVSARDANIGLTIDAEESDRLDLSLDIFEAVYRDPAMRGWEGLGLAVQAYQKRALPVLQWLAAVGRDTGRRIPLRLVKGAYWDSEIKRAQQQGLDGYPVFTRKAATDVSYLACARFLLDHGDVFYPQFATHNAYTAAYLLAAAGERRDFEFQRLHGMGEGLYQALAEQYRPPWPAGCTPRWAPMRPCFPTWCAAFWKTAPTPRSSTSWPTRSAPSSR